MEGRAPRNRRRAGAISIFVLLALVCLLALGALAVDGGSAWVARAQLQNAVDAGALAGAAALNGGEAAAKGKAVQFANYHRAAFKSVAIAPKDVEVGVWDLDTRTFTAQKPPGANSVHVSAQAPLSLFLAPIFGRFSMQISADATAYVAPSLCGAFVGLDKVTMSASSHTDSFDSSQGPYSPATAGSQGNVCTNGDITMSGSATIHGNGRPGMYGQVKTSGTASVTGSTEPLSEPLSFPPVDFGDVPFNNDNDQVPLSAGGKDPLEPDRDFSLSGGDVVDLPPGTYYFNKISLSGGSQIRISGPTAIYATGTVAMSGGSFTNQTLLAANLLIYITGATTKLSGSSEFYGLVYAPTSKVERSGESDYYGAIIGKELTLSGSGGLHYDEALAPLLGAGMKRAVLVE